MEQNQTWNLCMDEKGNEAEFVMQGLQSANTVIDKKDCKDWRIIIIVRAIELKEGGKGIFLCFQFYVIQIN